MLPGLMPASMMQSVPSALVLIDRTAGTNIGDMTDGGGLASVFDGNTSQQFGEGAKGLSGNQGYVGKTLAAPKIFGRAMVYGSTNEGFVNNSTPNVTLRIRGKVGAAPSSRTDGTILGSVSFADTSNESAGREIVSNDLVTAWDHIWVELSDAFFNVGVTELELWEWA